MYPSGKRFLFLNNLQCIELNDARICHIIMNNCENICYVTAALRRLKNQRGLWKPVVKSNFKC